MRYVYSAVHYLGVPLILAHLLWRALRNRAYLKRWAERFGFVHKVPGDAHCIWIHAVSVGEAQAAVPVVKGLQERFPESVIVITTTTPTGFERVKLAFGADVVHCYMPYDLPDAVNRFLKRIRPRLAIVFETELWPNVFHHCHRRGIKLLLVNARLSARSAAGYARLGGLVREMLSRVTAIAAQSEDDATRLVALGAPAKAVSVTGSVKFDVRLPASLIEQAQVLRRLLGVERNVWIAASTHEGEDDSVLDAFSQVSTRFADALLVLVPRHPERFSKVTALCRRRGFVTARRSDGLADCDELNVVVGDTMGELPLFYAAGDVAFVGGSLVSAGGHNMLEPAALGVPVIFGPHVFNFADISRKLIEHDAAEQVHDAEQLAQRICALFADANMRHAAGQRARDFVLRNGGAGERVLTLIEEVTSLS